MKKLLFVFVFAFIGITSTYANNATRQALQIKTMHNAEYILSNKSVNLPDEKIIIGIEKNADKCIVTMTIKSDATTITITATAPTCTEARAEINKLFESLVKA